MLVRLRNNVGTYVLRNPRVVESVYPRGEGRVGLKAVYKMEDRSHRSDFEHEGIFWINQFVSVERLPEQMTMEG